MPSEHGADLLSAPASEDELASLLADASRAGETVVFRGGGTRLDLGQPVPHVDRIVDLRQLHGIIEHHVRDLTVEAWAGTTVAELNEALAPHRQFLPLDPAEPTRATLGGVIAVAEPGVRTVPGARPRDLLLGMRAVLADGTAVRAGGRVVKNVTGYELTKLFTGSFGTLGAITRVTLRLRALPEASRTLVATLPANRDESAERFAECVLTALTAIPTPAAVALVSPGFDSVPADGNFRLAARFEGSAEETDLSFPASVSGAGSDLREPDDTDFWNSVRDFPLTAPPAFGGLGLALHGPTTALLRTVRRLVEFGPVVAFPSQRRALAAIRPDDFDSALAVVEPGVGVTVETAPPGWKDEHPVFHPPPPAPIRALSRRIKTALDPQGILAPGCLPL